MAERIPTEYKVNLLNQLRISYGEIVRYLADVKTRQEEFIHRIKPGTSVWKDDSMSHFGTTVGGSWIYQTPLSNSVKVKNIDGVKGTVDTWDVSRVIPVTPSKQEITSPDSSKRRRRNDNSRSQFL